MYRIIDSNHCQNNFWLEIILMGYPPPQNNFDENTLTAKKIFQNNFGVWPCFDPMTYSTFGRTLKFLQAVFTQHFFAVMAVL